MDAATAQRLEDLENWLQLCLVVTAVCTTLFPVLWALMPGTRWFKTVNGRLLMLQSVAFAAAIDLTAIFQFWDPGLDHLMVLFWSQAVIFGLIALASLLLTYTMARMNYTSRKKVHQDG